jgi:hypothetical protein
MNIKDACEIRDQAIELGLQDCCDECRAALAMLAKLGYTTNWTLTPNVPDPTYPQGARVPTLGIGTENAARYLRRQIKAPIDHLQEVGR